MPLPVVWIVNVAHVGIFDDAEHKSQNAGDDEYEAEQPGAEQQGQGSGFGVEVSFNAYLSASRSVLRWLP